MKMSEDTKIEIWQTVTDSDNRAALPTFGKARGQVVEVDASVLTSNLQKLLREFQKVLDEQPESPTGYRVEEIELNLAVSGKGGFTLIGMVEAGVQASVKVKIKRASDKA
jgi:hypothetical protein